MVIVMNRIAVKPDFADAFEDRFKERAALVDRMPGFVSFRLLRPATEGAPFVVETHWECREDFEQWTKSDEFQQGHARAGRLPREAFAGHPKLEIFEIVQSAKRGEILDSPEIG